MSQISYFSDHHFKRVESLIYCGCKEYEILRPILSWHNHTICWFSPYISWQFWQFMPILTFWYSLCCIWKVYCCDFGADLISTQTAFWISEALPFIINVKLIYLQAYISFIFCIFHHLFIPFSLYLFYIFHTFISLYFILNVRFAYRELFTFLQMVFSPFNKWQSF